MNTTEVICGRRAVRDFTDQLVPDSILMTLLQAATQAPSALNAQPWAFVIVQDKAILDQISQKTAELLLTQPISRELREKVAKPGWSIFYNAQTLILICAKPEGLHPDWDCCFAGENLMLAARDMGLGSCVIGMSLPALSEPDIRSLLNIPESYSPVVPIILGYPQSFPSGTNRKAPDILTWKSGAAGI